MNQPSGIGKFDDILAAAPATSPWAGQGSGLAYEPDFALLRSMLHVPVAEKAKSQSGLFGKCLDAWLAHEYRRAGFDPDAVWPRASEPRVLSSDIARLLAQLPEPQRDELHTRLQSMPSVAPKDANIHGRAYTKQVDVSISSWQLGPELLVSTKAQNSSFGNNLANRFEEAYGDAGNLRARFPLAAVGFAFFMRSTILDSPLLFSRAVDMMRKLRDRGDGNGYTATCLVLTHWSDAAVERGEDDVVSLNSEAVPADLHVGQFMASTIDTILSASPITHHTYARALRGTGNSDVTAL